MKKYQYIQSTLFGVAVFEERSSNHRIRISSDPLSVSVSLSLLGIVCLIPLFNTHRSILICQKSRNIENITSFVLEETIDMMQVFYLPTQYFPWEILILYFVLFEK